MSKSLITALALAGFALCNPICAEEGAKPAGDVKAGEHKEVKPVGGAIVSIGDNKLVIKGRKDEATFTTNEKTAVVVEGVEGKALTDLKVGMKVRVTAVESVATKIEVVKPMGDKKEGEKKEGDKAH